MTTEADQLIGNLNDGHHHGSEERMDRSKCLTRMGLAGVFVVFLGMCTVFLNNTKVHSDVEAKFQGTRVNALGGSIYPSRGSSQ